MQDLLKHEHRQLMHRVRRIDREMHRDAGQLEQLRRRTEKEYETGKREQAWQAALELHRARIAYRMSGIQKNNVERVADKLKQQLNAVTVDNSLVLVTRVMAARMQIMNPGRFARLMQQYDELKTKEEMNEEQLNDFFSANEDRDMERTEDELGTDEQRVMGIFAELGLVPQAPDVPTEEPGASAGGSSGGGGGGGGDNDSRIKKDNESVEDEMN